MNYKIIIDIESSDKLNPANLQHVKSMAEEALIENLKIPNGVSVFVNSKVTKENE